MRFLNEAHELEAIGWEGPQVSLLWRYNQHYFDDLNAAESAERREWHNALLTDWLTCNPPQRSTAWASYPTSLRIVNWIKWCLGGVPPTTSLLNSLAVQVRWLAHRLEWHLLGNHLFANAKALVFAGLFFEGEEAHSWLQLGERILERELTEQILADGAQFERSPMYHALALEDVLDLLNLMTALAPTQTTTLERMQQLRQIAIRMLRWLRYLQHPDGTLARFNDCAEGIAPASEELERYAFALDVQAPKPLAQELELLQPSGYLRVARGPLVALLDLAPIEPDYLPGHAHADTLSFELSLGGRPLIVNRGTSIYGTGERRQLERGTAMHSTVQMGTHNSSEVWGGFRVGRRARPGPIRIDGWSVHASHDGYAYLAGRPHHHRCWRFEPDGLQIEDWLDPVNELAAVSRLHLAPGLMLAPLDAAIWGIYENQNLVASIQVLEGRAEPSSSSHARGFGDLVEATTLQLHLINGRSACRLSWES